ncbi:MAG TPA: hypothetical protein VMN36_07450 [Verrucomicrobiales bacterium]|nr:hypothetical protein [Verrucomicrobiales bacterium]
MNVEAPPSGFEALGMVVDGLGDLDGDGVPDLGAGTGPNDDAIILSGADGRRLAECLSDDVKILKQFVVETDGIGDLDGDGVGDVAVGRTGSVKVISGRDGAVSTRKTGQPIQRIQPSRLFLPIVEKLNGKLRSWFEYFQHADSSELASVDQWVPGRLRSVPSAPVALTAEGLEKCSSSFSLNHSEDLRKEPMGGTDS